MKYSYHASLLVRAFFVLVSMVGITGCTDTLVAPNDTHYINTSENSEFAGDEIKRNDEEEAEEDTSSGQIGESISSDTDTTAPRALPAGSGGRMGGSRAKKIIRRY